MNHGLMIATIMLSNLAAAVPASAPVPSPSFAVGDVWVFEDTVERGTQGYDERRLNLRIERTGPETMLLGIKRNGAPGPYEDHIIGADWSLRRIMNGHEGVTARPFVFPLTIGQSWTVDYVDPTQRGQQSSLHVHRTYRVVGWEDVTVPAGRYHALDVEASGVDQAMVTAPSVVTGSATSSATGSTTATHSQLGGTRQLTVNFHADLYYVPSVKNYVKSVEEQFNTDDVLVKRETRQLVSFQPAS